MFFTSANSVTGTGWLGRNAIVATALNPLIGYAAAAELVKAALQRNISIREAALERMGAGTLLNKQSGAKVTAQEVDAVLGDLRRLTEGGIQGVGSAG